MSLLGDNLQNLLNKGSYKFKPFTVCNIAYQVLQRIENLHQIGVIHQDIKPDNFSIGLKNKKDKIYMFDFGLSQRYKDQNNQHVQPNANQKMVGTARFCSLNSHNQIQLSRRDDMISLGYMFIYFLTGKLPWMNLKDYGDQNKKFQKIQQIKQSCSLSQLCLGEIQQQFKNIIFIINQFQQGSPQEFYEYMDYVLNLKFDQEPNYEFLRGLMQKCLKKTQKNPEVFKLQQSNYQFQIVQIFKIKQLIFYNICKLYFRYLDYFIQAKSQRLFQWQTEIKPDFKYYYFIFNYYFQSEILSQKLKFRIYKSKLKVQIQKKNNFHIDFCFFEFGLLIYFYKFQTLISEKESHFKKQINDIQQADKEDSLDKYDWTLNEEQDDENDQILQDFNKNLIQFTNRQFNPNLILNQYQKFL